MIHLQSSSFGSLLKRLREDRSLSQKDLAIPGLSRSLISLYECGRVLPTYDHIRIIAQRLGVSPEVFFGGASDAVQNSLCRLMAHATKLEEQGLFPDAADLWDAARSIVMTYDLTIWRSITFSRFGLALTSAGQWERAFDVLLNVMANDDIQNDSDTKYFILRSLGECSRQLGRPSEASTFFQLARMNVSPSDERWIRSEINIGSSLLLAGRYTTAVQHYSSAVQVARESGHGSLEAWALLGLTSCLMQQEILETCEAYLIRAQHLGDVLDDRRIQAGVVQNYATWFRLTERWSEVKDLLAHLDEFTEDLVSATLLEEKLLLAAHESEWTTCHELLNKAIKLPILGPERGRIWLAWAKVCEARGDEGEKLRAMDHAREAFLGTGRHHDISRLGARTSA